MIVDFLFFLHKERGLAVSTIKGYSSTISSVLQFTGLDLGSSRVVRDLLRGLDVRVPRCGLRPPAWDLNVVLALLRGAPFEPLEEASLRNLTIKTLFLLAFASAQRMSELQALSASVGHSQDWSDVKLSFVPGFRPKTDSARRPMARSLLIPALPPSVGEQVSDLRLCPVRALRTYLDKTAASRPGVSRLFVSVRNVSRPMSKNAISFFLRQAILLAFQDVSEDVRTFSKVQAREIRALASSTLFRKNMSLSDIRDSAIWRSESTFISFYLRDVSHTFLDISSLGPVVAARRVV